MGLQSTIRGSGQAVESGKRAAGSEQLEERSELRAVGSE